MHVSATGWWIEEAGPRAARAPLQGDRTADVVVIGGGYTGLWAAWHVLAQEPSAKVAIVEAGRCGHGPSGRNGGFCESYWRALPLLRRAFGDDGARRLAEASSETVTAIGAWCEQEQVDAWFDQAGSLLVATGPAQRARVAGIVAASAALGAPGRAVALDAAAVRARCNSPVFGDAVLVPDFATVHPARLAFGLRDRLLAAGAEIYEGTRVREVQERPGALRAVTAGGSITAGAGVLAVNAATRGWPGFSGRLATASSHVVVTEPVPDVLEQIGWTGGESITDGGALVHYFRTTRDRRIVFGWAGGPIPCGTRLRGRAERSPATLAAVRRELVRIFPQLAGRQVTHGWGGPIDVSPNNLPQVDSHGRLHVGFGYTGNGVGPSHLVGRTLASLALDRRDAFTALPIVGSRPGGVPPEPLAWAGGAVVRAALAHRDRRDTAGRRPNPVATAVTAVPRLLGIQLGR